MPAMKVTAQGKPLTLEGHMPEVGDKALDFTVLDVNFTAVSLLDFKDKIVIISAVPSLDTSVCQLQTTRFNQEASVLDAVVLTISMDLPFAQKRFCDSFNVKNIKTLSDFKDKSFSLSYGVYIRELGLIARSVWIIDKAGTISYRQIVPDITREPDYDDVIKAAKAIGA
ncbi:MAG: thiol peroxidase [Spirochaetes bacterium]|nr:thiol peroxidase [Spirochaetota bacterium]